MRANDLLLEILCKANGSVGWSVTCVKEQWGSEQPPEMPLFFEPQERTIQLVSPESIGLTAADIGAYLVAENRYQAFCELHGGEVGVEEDTELQLAVEAAFERIQMAILAAMHRNG
jgi:hypothetical protein